GLLASIPDAEAPGGRLKQIPGTQPSPADLPSGCPFRTRCRYAVRECETPPKLTAVGPGRSARCHFPRAAA
ncbi:MAG: oligopeptide/dipeptide ABC transporter ATP-binding protein, partial [Pseudomonadota bacterium]